MSNIFGISVVIIKMTNILDKFASQEIKLEKPVMLIGVLNRITAIDN